MNGLLCGVYNAHQGMSITLNQAMSFTRHAINYKHLQNRIVTQELLWGLLLPFQKYRLSQQTRQSVRCLVSVFGLGSLQNILARVAGLLAHAGSPIVTVQHGLSTFIWSHGIFANQISCPRHEQKKEGRVQKYPVLPPYQFDLHQINASASTITYRYLHRWGRGILERNFNIKKDKIKVLFTANLPLNLNFKPFGIVSSHIRGPQENSFERLEKVFTKWGEWYVPLLNGNLSN